MGVPKLANILTNDPLASEEEIFRQRHKQLLRRYEGQFIALYHGRVVGNSNDDEKLAGRMFKKFGDVPFYIVKVEKGTTVYDVSTPEIVR